MHQSSTRTNFLDILVDPTTIALLGSIALHAIIGANLPFFNQLEKEGKKAEPSTVKVVELTPGELQRIPQAPPIATTPVLPPVTPQIAPNSATVPFSPIRIPLETIIPTPAPGKKTQQAIPRKQPTAPIFAPNNSFKPTPTPNKPPIKTGVVTKPSPIPTPLPITKTTKILTSPNPSQTSVPDDDGGDTAPKSSAVDPNRQAQSQPGNQPTVTPSNSSPQPTSSTPPTNNSAGNRNGGDYGAYAQDVAERIKKYVQRYPTIKLYPPKQLTQKYPLGIACSKLKQAPFIVLMAGFDKIPEGQDNNILGDTTSQPLDNNKSYTGDQQILANEKLLETSTTAGFVAATEAEKSRPAADKGVPVLYQYRVQFDPASCKN